MNEKVGYLNVFFQRSRPSWLPSQENIADYFPDPVFLYNTGTDSIEYANQKFAELARSSSDEMNDYGFLKAVLHPDDHENFQRLICSNPHPNEGHHAYCIARLADRFGRYRFHRIDGNFLPTTEAQQTQLILFVAHDITDELKSKAEIETTRELLDETEELLQFGSWAWEVTTNIVTWTPGLFTLLEYSPGEVNGRIGLSFYLNHVVEEYQQPFQELLQTALNSKSDFSYEYVIKTNSGVLKNISTKGKIVKDDNGEVMKMLCINRDITALRSFEKEQERNIRELNRSNRDLEEFAYIASHDLQEPLRKISMFTERLKAKFDNTLDKEGELFIERILASANNMRILIDNLLDFSRANRRSHTFDEVNIKTILDAVISELELKIEETKANINFSGSFPTIEAVTSEMAQLFSNILSNAIKFRKSQGTVEIEVRASKLSKTEKHVLGLSAGQNFHKIEVQDNGIGFEPEYSEKIFQIFQRLNGKSEYPGSGIGLAICKKIVEKHNGLIFAKSQPEQGATFTVILPEKQF
jgi:PAS domain S-box-containing protein